jgi:hypothetical protein
MDVMVQWDDAATGATPLARVSAIASLETLEAPSREIVTLYGTPTPESLALALAATLEARKASRGGVGFTSGDWAVTELDGAVGGTEWRDRKTGEIIRRELAIPFNVLRETAQDLLAEGGQSIRRLLAGLLMPDWPEGTIRALTFQLAVAGAARTSDTLAAMREADAENFADDE